MVRATLKIIVKSGLEEEFQQVWHHIAERVREEPGSLRQALLRDPTDASSFVIESDWDSSEAFGRFERSPFQDDLTAPLRELRESSSMTLLEVVDYVE